MDTLLLLGLIYLMIGLLAETFLWYTEDEQEQSCSYYLIALFIVLFWPLFVLLVATGYRM